MNSTLEVHKLYAAHKESARDLLISCKCGGAGHVMAGLKWEKTRGGPKSMDLVPGPLSVFFLHLLFDWGVLRHK